MDAAAEGAEAAPAFAAAVQRALERLDGSAPAHDCRASSKRQGRRNSLVTNPRTNLWMGRNPSR
jgi:hypothetical protein